MQCTTNKLGRVIERTEYQEYTDRNNDRVNINPEYYRQRQQIIEHQFGTLKRQWHFDYTLTRTKEKVLGEVYLAFTCYNLKRILSIFGFEALINKIKDVFILFSSKYVLLRIKKSLFKNFLTKKYIPIKNKNNFYIFE
ncbi:transposase [Aquimarina mycalae]|uniref:transposase n=1 Tax=Aquimarina mycalae TaxID=3040073 RepID=UPI00403AC18D